MNRLLLYFGDNLVGDVNTIAKNRKLTESLKSENSQPSADTFTFDVNWKQLQQFIGLRFDDPPETFLRVGKLKMVFETDGYVRFAGWLALRPSKSGNGAQQTVSMTFYEHFARLSGGLVCAPDNENNPYREFVDRPAHLFVKDLIDDFKSKAYTWGEMLNWDYGVVDNLANKTATYKDFQTIAKALCDAMNNTEGAGKFDVVFRTDPDDYQHQFVDILKPRGKRTNITIEYPSDGVYKLWASNYSSKENGDFASSLTISGNGELGGEGEQTAVVNTFNNGIFAKSHLYYRIYESRSNIYSSQAMSNYLQNRMKELTDDSETPDLELVGRPISWGNENGLSIGDSFIFSDESGGVVDTSGRYRIIGIDTSWDDNGVADVKLSLLKEK